MTPAIADLPLAIQIHLLGAVPALILGAAQFWGRKGGARHRLMGRIWGAAIVVTSLSSFWIAELRPGHFSPIHLLSILSLASLAYAIWCIRRRRVAGHKRAMIMGYLGLLAAFAFTFMPDRLLGQWAASLF